MTIVTIPKESWRNIHSAACEEYDIDISFTGNFQFAIVLASFYERKLTKHRSESACINRLRSLSDYSYEVIDRFGNTYIFDGQELVIQDAKYPCLYC